MVSMMSLTVSLQVRKPYCNNGLLSKYNTDVKKNRNNSNTAISYIYRNTASTNLAKHARSIRNTPILVAKVLTIGEMVIHAKKKKTSLQELLTRVTHLQLFR